MLLRTIVPIRFSIQMVCLLTASLVSTAGFTTEDTLTSSADPVSYKLPRPSISAEFPFESQFQEVLGAKMHYVEVGSGKPIIFIHGNPTSSYLWRNILPMVQPYGRAIAIDLIGMGLSDKPDISYTFAAHYQYVEQFINNLDEEEITLVVHDWGAALGFNYARNHPGKVKAIAFMEPALPPQFPAASLAALPEPLRIFFTAMRDPIIGYESIIKQNSFIEQALPGFINRSLSEAEMAYYRSPYIEEASRLPLWVWPQEVPIGGDPSDVTETFHQLRQFMIETETPMLLLYALPGAIVTPDVLAWYGENIEHLETNYVGQGFHFIQEDQPRAIGRALADWLRRLDD